MGLYEFLIYLTLMNLNLNSTCGYWLPYWRVQINVKMRSVFDLLSPVLLEYTNLFRSVW